MKNCLLITLIVLQFSDIVTTYLALTGGKGAEGNGLLAPLIKRFGLVPTLIVAKGAFVGMLVWSTPQLAVEVLVPMAGFYCWVIYNNVKVLRIKP